MTVRAYEADAEFVVVRSFAGPRLDTMTRGYSSEKIDAVMATMVVAVAANARPSRRTCTNAAAVIAARIAPNSATDSSTPSPAVTRVHAAHAVTTTATTGASARAIPSARRRSSAVVRSARNTAPWTRHTRTTVAP